MNNAHLYLTSSVLANEKVLVAGSVSSTYLNTVELYDLATGTWASTGNMNDARFYHTASILVNGKVLVAGGFNGARILNTTELH
jgi:N-acetylneuraminic acid mutarotase